MAKNSVPRWLFIVGIVLGVFLIVALFFSGTYNSFVTLDENVNNAWANVQSAYQRRADLIPNLIAVVDEAADFEQETQTKIAELRSQAVAAKSAFDGAGTQEQQLAAIRQLDTVSANYRGLNINVENYPQLRATANFADLQVQLEGTENRIKVERDNYNKAVRNFNVKVRRFPSNILAGMFGFSIKEAFEADAGSENAPNARELFNN